MRKIFLVILVIFTLSVLCLLEYYAEKLEKEARIASERVQQLAIQDGVYKRMAEDNANPNSNRRWYYTREKQRQR